MSAHSSTVTPGTADPAGAREKFLALDHARTDAGLSIARLSLAAGVGIATYRRLRHGHGLPSGRTLRALDRALRRLATAPAGAAGASEDAALWRLSVIVVSADLGLNPAHVLDRADTPGIGAGWKKTAIARHRALYLLVTAHGLPMVRAAAAAGISKQAVSKALRAVEDSRDDDATDHALDRLATLMTGGDHAR